MNLAVSGAHGRMGQRIIHFALEDKDLNVTHLLEHPQHPKLNESIHGLAVSSDPTTIKGSDVLIEFTSPEGTMQHLKACIEHSVKMVIGTTGLSDTQIAEIQKASEKIAIVFSSNMSIGVNIFFGLAQELAEKTKGAYHVRISETHHVHKKDKPSGTAKTLAEYVKKGSGETVEDIASIREGEVVGDHDVFFESPEDIITIKHHAKSRDIFVKGALVAAKFLSDKDKGIFDMQTVLGLK